MIIDIKAAAISEKKTKCKMSDEYQSKKKKEQKANG